jgi:hypothetical protein
MPHTVDYSFTLYRDDTVDLDSDEVKTARKSRDYLVEQVSNLADKDDTFPRLVSYYKPYGSFARSTKVHPLDDVDLLLVCYGKGTTAHHHDGYTYWLRVDEITTYRKPYMDDYGYLNSTKMLNKLKGSLASVSNYRKAEIKRNGVAVVLSLASYPWVFDIVPAFPIGDGKGNTDYFLIPDASGEWKRTDPRKDQELVTAANQQHSSRLLPVIRLLKYWNAHRWSPPALPSYYLEVMLLQEMRYRTAIPSIKGAVPTAFRALQSAVLGSCPDPKGLGENLEVGVAWDKRVKVYSSAGQMAQYADEALSQEAKGDHKAAIGYWSRIFPGFPAYG